MITSEAELREIVGVAQPLNVAKIADRLNDLTRLQRRGVGRTERCANHVLEAAPLNLN